MGNVPDFDLAADKLLRDVILNLVNRYSRVALYFPGHPVHETGIQPFLGFRAAKLRGRTFVPLIGLPVDSLVEAVVVSVNIIGIDFVKLFQAVNLGCISTKEELFLDTPPVTFLLAFIM